jgi:hypothetical protein
MKLMMSFSGLLDRRGFLRGGAVALGATALADAAAAATGPESRST